uniref:Uncharacterized protein n=1 Tax=Mycena chlorophos TaxID=658473 RepID=A0ABQ0LE95_MYCCL|nr:predicted protein [Mycena chlorophos]
MNSELQPRLVVCPCISAAPAVSIQSSFYLRTLHSPPGNLRLRQILYLLSTPRSKALSNTCCAVASSSLHVWGRALVIARLSVTPHLAHLIDRLIHLSSVALDPRVFCLVWCLFDVVAPDLS